MDGDPDGNVGPTAYAHVGAGQGPVCPSLCCQVLSLIENRSVRLVWPEHRQYTMRYVDGEKKREIEVNRDWELLAENSHFVTTCSISKLLWSREN